MIQSNELRIGNYLLLDNPEHRPNESGKIHKICGIKQKSVDLIRVSDNPYNDSYGQFLKYLQPIPLTREILLKFGFKENYISYKIDNNKYLIELHFYDCWNLTYIEKPKYGKSSVELSGYWNLHELQNLFFALTGEELA